MKLSGLIITLVLGMAQAVPAMDPPDRPLSFGGRSRAIDPALGIGNSSFDPELVAGLRAQLSADKGGNLLSWRSHGLPSEGTPRMLVLLIEFDEYPARPGDTPQAVHDRIFGAGGEFPFESLSAYYRRSSHGKLDIKGDVIGWYKAGRRGDVVQTREGREALIKRALRSLQGRDLSLYDNNGDGVIDYFAVVWTGPTGEWATFWWGMASHFSDKAFVAGGKTLKAYSWQGLAARWEDPSSGFRIRTLVHETGHALGLPDYYDYKPGVGPDGGLGHFDMMDSNHYDHNCFSKLMLGWVEPKIINMSGTFRLRPAAEAAECLMLLPPGSGTDPFGEFFLVENRRRLGNDAEQRDVGEGLVIWHVDARLNAAGDNFLYNNQTTEHKLLKLLEADGLEEMEKGPAGSFAFGDFYGVDGVLGPGTIPSSRRYDGADTGITLRSLGGNSDALVSVELN